MCVLLLLMLAISTIDMLTVVDLDCGHNTILQLLDTESQHNHGVAYSAQYTISCSPRMWDPCTTRCWLQYATIHPAIQFRLLAERLLFIICNVMYLLCPYPMQCMAPLAVCFRTVLPYGLSTLLSSCTCSSSVCCVLFRLHWFWLVTSCPYVVCNW